MIISALSLSMFLAEGVAFMVSHLRFVYVNNDYKKRVTLCAFLR